jgi:hypothetical protein
VKSIANPLETILQPFRDINIASTYQQYSTFIDFVIYLIIFTGLSRFVLTKKFPGKEGKMINTGIAVILSIAMTVFSYTTGFKLENLAPLAAVILLSLVALTIFLFIKHIGGNTTTSGLASFIITYFLTRATFPEIYQWAQGNQFAAWIDAAILMSIPVLIVMLVMKAKSHLPTGKDVLSEIDLAGKGTQKTVSKPDSGQYREKADLAEQSTKEEKQAAKTEKVIGRDIKTIIEILKTKGITPTTAPAIREVLSDLQRQDSELSRSMNQLKLINQKLEQWDIAGFTRLSQTYNQLTPDNQRLLKEAIQVERQSIMASKAIQLIEKRIDQGHQEFQRNLSLALNELGHNNAKQAITYLIQAQRLQDESQNLLDKLRNVQKQLLRLTRGEVEIMNKLTT